MFVKGGKGRSGANADPFAKLTVSEATAGLLPGKPTELMKSSDGKSLLFRNFKLMDVGLQFTGSPTLDDWKTAGQIIKHIEDGRNWWIGDWLNACESRWGDKYRLAEEITGFTKDTLSDVSGVCAKIELPLRNGNLSFSVHRVVAPLDRDGQKKYLALAEQDELSVVKLRQRIERDALKTDPVIVERSPLLNKTHWTVLRRLRKGLELGDPKRISRDDIQHVREWLNGIEEALEEYAGEAVDVNPVTISDEEIEAHLSDRYSEDQA